AVAPQLALGVSAEMRPEDTQGRQVVLRERQQLGNLLAPMARGARIGSIFDGEQGHHGRVWLAGFGSEVTNLVGHGRKRAEELESLGPVVELVAKTLTVALIKGKRLAVLAEVGTAFKTCIGGLKLAIGSEHLALDEAEFLEDLHKDRHGRLDSTGPDTAAEVAQIVFARDSVVEAGDVAIALAFVVLTEVVTEAGIIGVAVDFGSDFK